jgi:hypothetical protein
MAPARLLSCRLQLHDVLWSMKDATGSPLTMCIQTNYERLAALEAQCRSWPGPLVAVLYMTLDHAGGDQLSPEAAAQLAQRVATARQLYER